jgi:hypothetical protein
MYVRMFIEVSDHVLILFLKKENFYLKQYFEKIETFSQTPVM